MNNLYVLLPCFNEEMNISPLLKAFYDLEEEIKECYELGLQVVCIDDGSGDGTNAAIKKAQKDYLFLTLLTHEKNKGLGMAVKTGMDYFHKNASARDYALIMDSDCTHDPKYMIEMLGKSRAESLDCVIASRYCKGSEVHGVPIHRVWASLGARSVYRMLLSIPEVQDYTCGYRLYKYEIVHKLKEKFAENYITKSGFSCMVELLYKLHICGARIGEIPFSLRYDYKGGVSKMRVIKTIGGSLRLIKELRKLECL